LHLEPGYDLNINDGNLDNHKGEIAQSKSIILSLPVNKMYNNMIVYNNQDGGNSGKNYFFLETFPNACFSPNVFGKMSFGEAIFPKSHYSDLEKLRENRDLHSVVTVHFGRFHSVVTVNVSDVSERGVFTELIYNDVSRGHSAIMQTIQVTIRGLSGWMRAANHNT
jgi:hypothetical protein